MFALSACASSTDTGLGGAAQQADPKIANLAVNPPEPPTPAEKAASSATEVYSRIATGANTCWFGSAGPLKKTYIYHAEADAPSHGGKAEIVVHVRDPSQPNPRGAKAFRIAIAPNEGAPASVTTENLKMAENVAAAMKSDVERWSAGDQGCAGVSTATAAGWLPQTPLAPPTGSTKKLVSKPQNPAAKPQKAAVAAKTAATP